MTLYDLGNDDLPRLSMYPRIPYPFRSLELQENIQNYYLARPESERFDGNRRNHERRSTQRRQRQSSELPGLETKYPPTLLTREERTLIEFLNRTEQESTALS